MTDMTRWGIIGAGGIATKFCEDLELLPDHEVVAVGTRTAGSADAFARRFGVAHVHPSYADLVADPDVDAVYVATPHPMHLDAAMLAIEAGKAVLVEKPFAMDAAEARALVEAARARGTFLMEAMWTRFLPHVAAIRDVIASGRLGEIVLVTAEHGQWFEKDAAFRLFAPELGGGALLDLGIYPVSFASMVLGTPDHVTAVSDPAFTGVDAQISMVLRTPAARTPSSPRRCAPTRPTARPSTAPTAASRSRARSTGRRRSPSSAVTARASASRSRSRATACATRRPRSAAACARGSRSRRTSPSTRRSRSSRRWTRFVARSGSPTRPRHEGLARSRRRRRRTQLAAWADAAAWRTGLTVSEVDRGATTVRVRAHVVRSFPGA